MQVEGGAAKQQIARGNLSANGKTLSLPLLKGEHDWVLYFSANLVGHCSHARRPCPLRCMYRYFLLMRTTGLLRAGKGRRQHMSKLHDAGRARGMRS